MKTLIAALILSTLAAPVLAMDAPLSGPVGILSTEVLFPTVDEFGRRSGKCPKSVRHISREGTTCGI